MDLFAHRLNELELRFLALPPFSRWFLGCVTVAAAAGVLGALLG